MSDRVEAAVAELAAALRAEILTELQPAGQAPERLLSIGEAPATCSIGRTRLYAEMSAGRIRSIVSGRRRLIPASAIAEFVAGQR
jgi:hypothetical protein